MKHKDYWQNRAIELENLMQKNTNQTMIAINKIYQKASESLTRKVNKIFTRYVTGGKINPKYARQLLNEKQTRKYRNELKKLLAETKDEKLRREIINTLDAPAYGARISRLEALRDNLYYEARAIGAKEVELAESRLVNVYEQSYYRTIYADQKNSGLYDFDVLTDRRIQAMLAHEWSNGNYSSRLWKNNEDFADKVAETIETGCLAGWTLDEMCNELKGRVIGDNPDKAQRFITSRLIRTEVNYFSNQGQLEGLKAAGFTKYRFIATLDLRTSEMCRRLDSKVFNIDEAEIGVNLPPLHPFCRSVIVPAYENENRAGRTRWARNPITGKGMKVPADMSYDEWYKKYVLSDDEKYALHQYISSESYILNEKLRQGLPLTDDENNLIMNLDSALDKMPKYQGNLNRSLFFNNEDDLNKFLKKHQVGNMVEYDEYISTTFGNVYNPDGQIQIYIANSKNGYDISLFNKGEKEVLYKRNNRFTVDNIIAKDGIINILLKEV
ncbi:MAG: minor capsid protein [Eubacterium sp.]|nr:minor capsid protein [Eubacterium sp.]